MAVAGFVASSLAVVTSFGDVVGDTRSGRTIIAVPGCANAEARGIDRYIWTEGGVQSAIAVAGDAACGSDSLVLALLESNRDPRPGFNGGAPVVVAHPSGSPLQVAGVRFVPNDSGNAGDPPWAYVAAKMGTTCSDTNHRSSLSQRYAYDVGAARWDAGAGKWTSTIEGVGGLDTEGDPIDGSKNMHALVYGKLVVAMADGRVLECYRDLDENPEPGVILLDVTAIAGGGNMLWVLRESG